MKTEFDEYLISIGIGEGLKTKIDAIYQHYQKIFAHILNEEINDIFVGEFIQQDNTRVYEEVVFFSDNFMTTSTLFSKKDNFDIGRLKIIERVEIEYQDYDLQKATEKSRLLFRFHVDGLHGGENKASKENCDKLYSLYSKYIIPRLKN